MLIKEIDNQGNLPACQSFGIGTLTTAKSGRKANSLALFNEVDRNGGGTNAKEAIRHCEEQGIPMVDGTRLKVKFNFINPTVTNLQKAVDEEGGFVFGYRLHDRDRLENRMDEHGILTRRPLDTHFMACAERDATKFRVANSWGTSWGNDGGFLSIPYVLMGRDYVTEAYSLTILK